MEVEKPLVNKIANSPLITLDLEQYAPDLSYALFDIKDFLFHGLILKEKDFRESLKAFDWTPFEGKDLVVFCSTDAIIPMWAYMLITTSAMPYVRKVYNMTEEGYFNAKWIEAIQQMDISGFIDKKMVIKGCSDRPIPPLAYSEITARLLPHANSIMFGEPCSTVPVFKAKAPVRPEKA